MNGKDFPTFLVSLAILAVPVKSGAEKPLRTDTEIARQLSLLREEIAAQGRRIAALEQVNPDPYARRTPGYNIVSPEPAAPRGNPADTPSKTYTVRLGDSVSSIARRHDLTIADIVSANQLVSADRIRIGQRLTIPEPAPAEPDPPVEATPAQEPNTPPREAPAQKTKTAPATSAHTHEIQAGETIFGIARRYGVAADDLQAYNGIADPTTVWAGQVLRIPGTSAPAPKAPTRLATTSKTTSAQKGGKDGTHTVVRGESLTKIAAAHGVRLKDLQAANGISDPDKLRIGQVLRLPGNSAAAAAPTVASKVTSKSTATKIAASPKADKKPTPTPIQPKRSTPKMENLGVDDYMGYYVVEGDTVESLASIFNTSAAKLRQINDLPSSGQFKPGMQILVPAASVFSS